MEQPKVVYTEDKEHPIKYKGYWIVWAILLALTGLTVWVSYLNFGRLSTIVSLTIATIKVSLVVAIFMHLYYEKLVFKYVLATAILTLITFIGLTFLDYAFR